MPRNLLQAVKPAPVPTVRTVRTTTTTRPSPEALDSRWLLDIPQACAALHVSRTALFRLLASAELGPSIKIGRRRLIPVSSVESYIARLIAEEGGQVA